MEFGLADLSNSENELIKNAGIDYGIIFTNVEEFICLMWNFISKVEPGAFIFVLYLSQTQKFLTLALLSVIRRHEVQAAMVLRHVLESAVLGAYGLYKLYGLINATDTEKVQDEFGIIEPDGTLKIKDTARNNAYKWIENNYKDYSDKIKYMKENVINKYFAHSNMESAYNNFEYKEDIMENSFFDKLDMLITKQQLWWIANISMGLLSFFAKIAKDYPSLKLIDDFDKNLRVLSIQNEQIKSDLMKDPRFSKWL